MSVCAAKNSFEIFFQGNQQATFERGVFELLSNFSIFHSQLIKVLDRRTLAVA